MASTPIEQVQNEYFTLTDRIPQAGWYWAAMISIAASASLWLLRKRHWSTFVGQWPPTFLLLALFHNALFRSRR